MSVNIDPVNSSFNTKWLMVASALFLGGLGVASSFLPEEILSFYNVEPSFIPVILMQVTGALFMGFAALNWMARSNLIGGIYSRPVAVGNFLHFMVVAILLVKQLASGITMQTVTYGSILYLVFAICFGYVLFGKGLNG